jgi:hypothetical protein
MAVLHPKRLPRAVSPRDRGDLRRREQAQSQALPVNSPGKGDPNTQGRSTAHPRKKSFLRLIVLGKG